MQTTNLRQTVLVALVLLVACAAAQRYSGNFAAVSSSSSSVLKPFLSPDNSEDEQVDLIKSARSTVDVELQYIRKFDVATYADHPLVQALISAASKRRRVRVILEGRKGADKDRVGEFLKTQGVEVRYMEQLKWNHNKLVLVDGKTAALSSVNWSEKSLRSNREAGMMVTNTEVGAYFQRIFDYDWKAASTKAENVEDAMAVDGEQAEAAPLENAAAEGSSSESEQDDGEESHEEEMGDSDVEEGQDYEVEDMNMGVADYDKLPKSAFPTWRGKRKLTAFANPDSSEDLILKYIRNAKKSVYLEIYSISHTALVNEMIALKKRVAGIDIRVLISYNRASYPENANTNEQAQRMFDAGIDVYKTTNALYFTHAKFWVVDGQYTFVYSGNWAGSSISSTSTPSSANREMGVMMDDKEIAAWWTQQVFNRDWSLGNPFAERESRAGFFDLKSGAVLSGRTTIYATVDDPYRVYLLVGLTGEENEAEAQYEKLRMRKVRNKELYYVTVDTRSYCQGVTELMVEGESRDGTLVHSAQKYVNFLQEKAKVVFNEVYVTGDTPTQEFVQVINTMPFDLVVSGWQIGEPDNLVTIEAGTVLGAGNFFTVARNQQKFAALANGEAADVEHSMSLKNSGDSVVLKLPTGETVDAVSWGSVNVAGFAHYDGELKASESLVRSPVNGPSVKSGSPRPMRTYPYIRKTPVPCNDLHRASNMLTSPLVPSVQLPTEAQPEPTSVPMPEPTLPPRSVPTPAAQQGPSSSSAGEHNEEEEKEEKKEKRRRRRHSSSKEGRLFRKLMRILKGWMD